MKNKTMLVDTLISNGLEDEGFLYNRLYEYAQTFGIGESVDEMVEMSMEDTNYLQNKMERLVDTNYTQLAASYL